MEESCVTLDNFLKNYGPYAATSIIAASCRSKVSSKNVHIIPATFTQVVGLIDVWQIFWQPDAHLLCT
jgi:hypothetical protein